MKQRQIKYTREETVILRKYFIANTFLNNED